MGMWSWLWKAPIESVLIPLWTLAGIMVKWASRPSSRRVLISVWYLALWLEMHWWFYAMAECEAKNCMSLVFSTVGIIIEVARWGLERRMSGLSARLLLPKVAYLTVLASTVQWNNIHSWCL